MEITKTTFRWLIVLSILTAIISPVISLAGASSLPEELQKYVREPWGGKPNPALMALLLLWALIVWPLLLAATIGLFVFWRPARSLNVVLWVLAFFTTPLLGPTVQTGWATSFRDLSMALGGVVIALAYFSPIKDLFRQKQRAAAPPAAQSSALPNQP